MAACVVIFSLLAGLSVLLFGAAAALWVRSYLPERVWVRWVDGGLVVVAASDRLAHFMGTVYFEPPPSGATHPRELVALVHSGSRNIAGWAMRPPHVTSSAGVEVYVTPTRS